MSKLEIYNSGKLSCDLDVHNDFESRIFSLRRDRGVNKVFKFSFEKFNPTSVRLDFTNFRSEFELPDIFIKSIFPNFENSDKFINLKQLTPFNDSPYKIENSVNQVGSYIENGFRLVSELPYSKKLYFLFNGFERYSLDENFFRENPELTVAFYIERPLLVLDLDIQVDFFQKYPNYKNDILSKIISKNPILESCPICESYKGFHIYFKCYDAPKFGDIFFYKTAFRNTYCDIFLGNQIVVPPSNIYHNKTKMPHKYKWKQFGTPPSVPWEKIKEIFKLTKIYSVSKSLVLYDDCKMII